MEMFHLKKDIPFMSYGRLTTTVSLATFLLAVFFLFYKGLNLSIEFTGGTVLEVRYSQPADPNQMRHSIEALNLSGKHQEIQVQLLGSPRDVMIRLPSVSNMTSAKLSETVMAELRKTDAKVESRKVEFVGPSVGEELLTHGLTALALVCVGIIIYLGIRFEWRFAVSAIIANLHDVVIILGVFAFFQWEFSLTVLAAVLAVLGYSVNESVVVFDRIRENFRKAGMRGKSINEVIDNAITATMSRTVITHGSTEVMVLAMLLFGGPALHGFAMALTIGIVFGIYSSVLVASPLLLLFGLTRESMVKPVRVKEEAVV
ncbi:protein translocase subunit SecF [Chitinimonas prasina]|uniref:protein translocase subunit SecF n=1 Tax=Chitinimonas prasina TaxID=1434937 RepID=UPI0024E0F8DB|nr:protein translocase subunit SecF [Chitinimonas prasina]